MPFNDTLQDLVSALPPGWTDVELQITVPDDDRPRVARILADYALTAPASPTGFRLPCTHAVLPQLGLAFRILDSFSAPVPGTLSVAELVGSDREALKRWDERTELMPHTAALSVAALDGEGRYGYRP